MISKKGLIAGMVSLVFVVGGAATVLQSFGTISGTAEVTPAVNITDIYSGNETIDLRKNTDQNIDAEDNLEVYNATTGSSEKSISKSSGSIEITSEKKNLEVNLTRVEKVGLRISGNVLEVEEVP